MNEIKIRGRKKTYSVGIIPFVKEPGLMNGALIKCEGFFGHLTAFHFLFRFLTSSIKSSRLFSEPNTLS